MKLLLKGDTQIKNIMISGNDKYSEDKKVG